MTNKPMLSVERELLEDVSLPDRGLPKHFRALAKLRALLDNPTALPDRHEDRAYCEALEQERDYLREQLKKPSSQQKGEPVAYLHRNTRHTIPALRNRWEPITVTSAIAHMQNKALAEEGKEDEWHLGHEFQKCYAEQPAQVATGTTSEKYKAELYDEVWQLARSMGFNNVTDAMTGRVSPQDPESECTSCDGSGEHTDAIGDWRGYCACPAGVEAEGIKGDKP